MNNRLQELARAELKEGLELCSGPQILLFKRMYSHKNLNADIEQIVDSMSEDKLDWAMQQVMRTKRVRGH